MRPPAADRERRRRLGRHPQHERTSAIGSSWMTSSTEARNVVTASAYSNDAKRRVLVRIGHEAALPFRVRSRAQGWPGPAIAGRATRGRTARFRHRFGTDADISRFVERPGGLLISANRDVLEDIVLGMDGIFLRESGGRMHVQVPEHMVADILLRGTR